MAFDFIRISKEPAMTATTAPDAILMRFQPTDTATKVSRATLT